MFSAQVSKSSFKKRQLGPCKVYTKFESWIRMINDLAIVNNINLLVKLPFRSDLLNLVKVCAKYAVDEYGVKGLTLINTVKAPYPFEAIPEDCNQDPGFIHRGKDEFGLPQMSGKGLKYLRDWVLFQTLRHLRNNKGQKQKKIWLPPKL